MSSHADSLAPPSEARSREAGFTLIELMVSLALLAVILSLLVGGLKVLSQSWDANSRRIDAIDMLSRAADILRRDAAGLQRIVATVGGAPRYLFTGTHDQLAFVTLEPPYPTAEGAYFVSYSVAANGPQTDLVRARARYRHGMQAFPGATPANEVRLLEGPYRYRFAYAQKSAGGGKWQTSWHDTTRLPELVRLQILDARRNELVSSPIVVAISADAELACLSEKARMCSSKTKGALNAQSAGTGSPADDTDNTGDK